MKGLQICCFLLLFPLTTYCQESTSYKNSIGIDAIGGFAALLGSYNRYDILELSYIRKIKQIDFRAKFNMNNRNFEQDKVLQNSYIDQERMLLFRSNFVSTINLQLSTGIAKRLEKDLFNYYYGIDIFARINKGYAISVIEDESNFSGGQYIGTLKSTNYNVGFTPLIGTKIPLFKRMSLEFEFGIPVQFNIGSINYLDETGGQKEVSLKGYEFGVAKILNDLRFSYNF